MAGLYIHIPFCRSRCIYCGFYSTTQTQQRQRYIEALTAEMKLRSHEAQEPISTVYIGGGTPSQLTTSQLQQLFEAVDHHFNCLWDEAEVTIECNPDDVTDELAATLHRLPVNRVSMGVQTLNDQRLQFLRRRHTAQQVHHAMQRLRHSGIDNVSVDLMYGFPDETLNEWQHDLQGILSLGAEHISAYALSYEEGTPLQRMIVESQSLSSEGTSERSPRSLKPLDEETERSMYYMLVDHLTAAGYQHYEISNFARPGFQSRHNRGYWTGAKYIGLGAAAHSYDGTTRRWNVSDLTQYMQHAESHQLLTEQETIDSTTRYNEHVMLSLRTCEGLDLSTLSPTQRTYCERQARRFLDSGLLQTDGQRLRLTRQSLFVSDMVISELFIG